MINVSNIIFNYNIIAFYNNYDVYKNDINVYLYYIFRHLGNFILGSM